MNEKPTKRCCDKWTEIAKSLGWCVLADEPRRKSLPFIGKGDGLIRVHFCPSCGASVAGIGEKLEP
jgi:hypothetical protein